MQRNIYLGFSEFSGIGPKRFAQLCNVFGSAENAWNASADALQSILGKVLTQKFITFRKTFSFEKTEEKLQKHHVSYVTIDDQKYPQLLKKIPSPPFILYIKGNISCLNDPKSIAVVGTRKISSYGTDVTVSIARDLVQQGYTIVSGLAFGVDAIAHETALASQGTTIAVLGCGVDMCYPLFNQKIYDNIHANNGAIVSTFRLGEKPNKGSFPARNAIIAGLSLGVVVTEGTEDSGSLITAHYAMQYKRPVFAVPGPITSPLSKGTNSLLQHGAIIVTKGEDIVNVILNDSEGSSHKGLGFKNEDMRKKEDPSARPQDDKKKNQHDNASREEKEIIDLLQFAPLHFDAIVRTIGKSAKEIGTLLSLMELKGMIKNKGGEYFL